MLTVLRMPDKNRFLELVKRSSGNVFLHLPDDTLVDVKRDHTAQQLLRSMDPGRNGLRFTLSEASDLPEFLRFMTECAC